jgi:hypothetical protein
LGSLESLARSRLNRREEQIKEKEELMPTREFYKGLGHVVIPGEEDVDFDLPYQLTRVRRRRQIKEDLGELGIDEQSMLGDVAPLINLGVWKSTGPVREILNNPHILQAMNLYDNIAFRRLFNREFEPFEEIAKEDEKLNDLWILPETISHLGRCKGLVKSIYENVKKSKEKWGDLSPKDKKSRIVELRDGINALLMNSTYRSKTGKIVHYGPISAL